MGQFVIKALNVGVTSFTVVIKDGINYFHDKHLNFSGLKYPNASIVFKGENAIILGSNTIEDGMFVNPFKFCYVNKEYQQLRL